ncbi:two-component system response regulator [Nibricoccus aquaticus]|uniref:Two-component system response regulator n=1 Tax=Nibricoccus aquaticus TaxID=2576891 RepID=A0A290Q4B6_9BACT|nr:response regulator [Nibricoccus aquaticus]ATC63137.1 two-component system response regulator [Nibricoccus aquaticus]
MNLATILLVEDEPTNVFFFQHAASKAGVTNPVQVAKDGQEAIDYLEGVGEFGDRLKYPLPGLVVLDLKLPRLTGFEVLKKIRAASALRRLIVVMLTSSASEEDINKAYALGINGYLVKPFKIEELISLVQALRDFWLTHNHPATRHAEWDVH